MKHKGGMKGSKGPAYKSFDLKASLQRKPTWQMKKGKLDTAGDAGSVDGAPGATGTAGTERVKIGALKSRKPLGARPSNAGTASAIAGKSAGATSGTAGGSVAMSAAAMAHAMQ